MLFVVIMSVAITSIVVATSDLTFSAIAAQKAREREVKAMAYLDGVSAKSISQQKAASLVVGSSRTETVDTQNVTTTATDNGGAVQYTLRFDNDTVVDGKTYRNSRVGGTRMVPKPSHYAIFSNSNWTTGQQITAGSAASMNGDISGNGSISLTNVSSVVYGDIEAPSVALAAPSIVVDNVWSGSPAIPFPTPVRANYSGAAVVSLFGNRTFTNYLFLSAYRLVYINGDLDISGVIGGTGVFYVTGNVRITGDITYATAGSRFAIICEGNLDWRPADIVGYYYVLGQVDSTGGPGSRILSKGGIAANTININRPFTVVHDPAVWTSSTTGINLKLPGFWP